MRKFKYIMCLMALFALIGCSKEDEQPTGIKYFPADELLLKADGEIRDLTFEKKEGMTYEVTSNVEWVTVNLEEGEGVTTCILAVSQNESSEVREGMLFVKANGSTQEIALRQKANEGGEEDEYLRIKNQSNNVTAMGGKIFIRIESNMAWKVEDSEKDWIKVVGSAEGSGCGVVPVEINGYSAELGTAERSIRIRVTSEDGSIGTFTDIKQSAFQQAEWKVEGLVDAYKATESGERTLKIKSNTMWDRIEVNGGDFLTKEPKIDKAPASIMDEVSLTFAFPLNIPGKGKRTAEVKFMKADSVLHQINIVQNNYKVTGVDLKNVFKKQKGIAGEEKSMGALLSDGDNATSYSTKSVAHENGTYLFVDFGWNIMRQHVSFKYKTPSYKVGGAISDNHNAIPYKIQLQVSNDASSWTTVKTLYTCSNSSNLVTTTWNKLKGSTFVADKSILAQWKTSPVIRGEADKAYRYWKMNVLTGANNGENPPASQPTTQQERWFFSISELWVNWYE